jgi:16S rRNA (uracil1498-N3)-methyltransferase
MRTSRILVQKSLEDGSTLEVSGEISHYIKTVLRLRKGWQLVIFDGRGTECLATIESFGRDNAMLRLGNPTKINRESPLQIHLILGISRGERMDYSIQKAVELGVSQITPIITENTVVKLDEDRKLIKSRHWTRIVQSACEQSGRNHLPEILASITFNEWTESLDESQDQIILSPNANSELSAFRIKRDKVTLAIGPEGGFTEKELGEAIKRGATLLRMGPRTLRSETAAVAAIAAMQGLWGDF